MSHEKITRRNLPHWFRPGACHFVTYRLAGTIPIEQLQIWRRERDQELRQLPRAEAAPRIDRERAHKRFFAKYDRFLDETCRRDWLRVPSHAAIIQENLEHHDGHQYHLLAWCPMPNHMHVLLFPIEAHARRVEGELFSDEAPDAGSPLSKIMHSIKSYTAHRINKAMNRTGRLWQHESYDHWVRDDDELERIVEYISRNPVSSGLASEPEDWPYCSAHVRFKRDGVRSSWLLSE